MLIAVGLLTPAPAAADPNSDAVNAVAGFNPQNKDTLDRLNQVIVRGGVNVRVLKPQLKSGQVDRRWAATYVAHALADSKPDYEVIAPRLRDDNESVRSLAAYRLIGVGQEKAIPVLIDLLRERGYMRHSEPPQLIAFLANERLVDFTKADFNFDAYASGKKRRKAIEKWEQWWSDVKDNIRWDRQAERYRWRRNGKSARRSADGSGPIAKPSSATLDQGFDGRTAKINLKVEIAGRPVPQSFLRRVQAAQDLLNNGARESGNSTGMCFNLEFAFDIKVRDLDAPATPGYQQMELAVIPRGIYLVSRAPIPPVGQTGPTGYLDTNDNVVEIAHEFSHIMGLPDEYKDLGNERTVPHDKESYMSDAQRGHLLQRHLDALASRFLASDQEKICQKYRLQFPSWESQAFARVVGAASEARAQVEAAHKQPGDHSHVIGEFASAVVQSDFWLNTLTGRVTTAGEKPCGSLVVTSPCPGEVGGNSQALEARADPGLARCSSTQLRWNSPRFPTTVSGEQTSGAFNLQLGVSDSQSFNYSCDPPASPASGKLSMIRDGMEFAGALAFTIQVPAMGSESTQDFSFADSSARAGGTVHVTRLE